MFYFKKKTHVFRVLHKMPHKNLCMCVFERKKVSKEKAKTKKVQELERIEQANERSTAATTS